MERIGCFSEVGYTTIGDKYPTKHPDYTPINSNAFKGKQMTSEGSKNKSATQAGYFAGSYQRIMENESFSDPIKEARAHRKKNKSKFRGRGIWFPSDGAKEINGAGNHYGTLSGKVTAMSAAIKPKQKKAKEAANMMTNPLKKGGFGFPNICIGPDFKFKDDPYDLTKELRRDEHIRHKKLMRSNCFKLHLHPTAYFDQNPFNNPIKPAPAVSDAVVTKPKMSTFLLCSPSGRSFGKYPSHSVDPYEQPKRKLNPLKNKKLFRPTAGPKTVPNPSIVDQNVRTAVTKQNFKYVENTIYKE